MAYEFSWGVIESSLPQIAGGIVGTIELASLTICAGGVLGILGVLLRFSGSRFLELSMRAYVEAIRNTPMLIQLYFIYYALPRFGIRLGSFATAATALSLYCGAYVLEILRAGIEATPRGQIEAARAIHLPESVLFFKIVLPQAWTLSLPALGGQAVSMVKLSSLASVISAIELTYVVVDTVATTYRAFEMYALAGVLYLAMTLVVSSIFRVLENYRRQAAQR